jgi:hypothetical protein
MLCLAETFGAKLTEATLAGYTIGLDGLSDAQISKGVTLALQTCKFMPRPSELRALAGEPTGHDQAETAWASVLRATRHGSYRAINFEDGLINATVRQMGGWPALLARSGEEFDKWAKAEFCRVYEALLRTGASDDSCRYLPGICETKPGEVTCSRTGTKSMWEPQPPMLIERAGSPKLTRENPNDA